MSDSKTETGTVKWFSAPKGFGFITAEDGEELFVHYNSIVGTGFRDLKQGANVTFERKQGEKGMTAVNVVALGE